LPIRSLQPSYVVQRASKLLTAARARSSGLKDQTHNAQTSERRDAENGTVPVPLSQGDCALTKSGTVRSGVLLASAVDVGLAL
jgi:hypothetical protein